MRAECKIRSVCYSAEGQDQHDEHQEADRSCADVDVLAGKCCRHEFALSSGALSSVEARRARIGMPAIPRRLIHLKEGATQRRTQTARSLRSQIPRDREVETLVKRSVVFLSGLATTITGVFIRSCESGVEVTLASVRCGKAPPGAVMLGEHAHCAGV